MKLAAIFSIHELRHGSHMRIPRLAGTIKLKIGLFRILQSSFHLHTVFIGNSINGFTESLKTNCIK